MAAKTYVPGLRFTANVAQRYCTRYQKQLSASLTSDQYTALLAFITCVAELLAALGPNPIGP